MNAMASTVSKETSLDRQMMISLVLLVKLGADSCQMMTLAEQCLKNAVNDKQQFL